MIELIPAIDIIDGRCVRLRQGAYDAKTEYDTNPVDLAKRYEDAGIRRLHVVDLDGARQSHVINVKTVEAIVRQTSLVVDFGGGIKSEEDLHKVFDAGVPLVIVGSLAVRQPEIMGEWLQTFGNEHFILGADARNGKISVNGWKETSELELIPFIESYAKQGVQHVLCTDIARDGMLQGPAVELYREIMQQLPNIGLIASGGVSSMDDIRALDAAGVPAVVIGKALLEGHISLKELRTLC